MAKVTSSIDIPAPPEDVWDVVMDPARFGDWVTIHRKVGKVSDRPLVAGSTLEQTLCLRGVNFHVKWEVEQAKEPRLAVWNGRGPARSKAHTAYRLSPDGTGGTRFDYENEFKPPLGPLGAAASRALVGGIPEREARNTLERLKSLFEK
jgi:carbon monoxide dehydrogenase subunit G